MKQNPLLSVSIWKKLIPTRYYRNKGKVESINRIFWTTGTPSPIVQFLISYPRSCVYCKQSKTGWWEGLGTRLHCTHNSFDENTVHADFRYIHREMAVWRTAARRDDAFEELLPTFWIRPATWLHSVHEIAVPISRSLQCSWWGLVYWPKCVLHSRRFPI